jgi:hypothetical protein
MAQADLADEEALVDAENEMEAWFTSGSADVGAEQESQAASKAARRPGAWGSCRSADLQRVKLLNEQVHTCMCEWRACKSVVVCLRVWCRRVVVCERRSDRVCAYNPNAAGRLKNDTRACVPKPHMPDTCACFSPNLCDTRACCEQLRQVQEPPAPAETKAQKAKNSVPDVEVQGAGAKEDPSPPGEEEKGKGSMQGSDILGTCKVKVEDGNGGEKDEGKEVAHVKEEEREEKTAIARGSLDKGEDTMQVDEEVNRALVGDSRVSGFGFRVSGLLS